jgi:hypothetical protein
MDKALWAKRVVDKLHTGERNIDTTIRSLTELLNELQDAQADLNISPVSSNPTLTKVMEAMMALQDARTHLTTGHRRLEQLGKAMQIRTVMYGPQTKIDGDVEEAAPGRAEAR